VSEGALPEELSLDINGVISGTPIIEGTSRFSIIASNSSGAYAETAFSIRIESSGNTSEGGGLTGGWSGSGSANETNGTDFNTSNQNNLTNHSNNNTQPEQNQDNPSVLHITLDDILSQLTNGENPVIAMGEHTQIALSGSVLLEILKAGKTLTIKTDISSLMLNTDNIMELDINPDDEIVIDFYLYAESVTIDQPDVLNEELAGNFYYLSIIINGVKVENFITPLTLQFDLSAFRLTNTQRIKTTGIRYLGEGLYNQLGGKFISRNIYEFKTSKLSIYGVIISETLISIETTIDKHEYYVNGTEKLTDTAPMIKSDRTMVPIRFIAEAFGADVEWINETQSVIITLDGKTLHMTIDELLPGMDVSPFIHNDRTMVPLRYISEHFEANVVWDTETRNIYLYR
jgi:hypothetical protein